MAPHVYAMLCAATAGTLLLGGCADPPAAPAQPSTAAEAPAASGVAFLMATDNGTSPAGGLHRTAPEAAEPGGEAKEAAPPDSQKPGEPEEADEPDAPQIEVGPRGGLVVAESGRSAEVAVTITARPDGDVVLDASSTAPDEGLPDPETLRFTPEDWDTPQVLSVKGVDDRQPDGDQPFRVRLAVNRAATTDRTGYAEAAAREVAATNLDDETLHAEGSLTDPLDVTLLQPGYRGQVDHGDSYYVVRNLDASVPSTVQLTDLSADADVTVYADPAFSRLLCHSDARGTHAERCAADPAAVLYIQVSGRYSAGGATYFMDVN